MLQRELGSNQWTTGKFMLDVGRRHLQGSGSGDCRSLSHCSFWKLLTHTKQSSKVWKFSAVHLHEKRLCVSWDLCEILFVYLLWLGWVFSLFYFSVPFNSYLLEHCSHKYKHFFLKVSRDYNVFKRMYSSKAQSVLVTYCPHFQANRKKKLCKTQYGSGLFKIKEKKDY